MKFKSLRVEHEWNDPRLNPLLRSIVEEAASFALARHDWEITLTCIWRSPDENDALYAADGKHRSGVHPEWRAVDARTMDVDPSAVLDVTTFLNDRYLYDTTRPMMRVALPEGQGFGSNAQHLHFQVSSLTERRETTPAEPKEGVLA